MAGTLVLLGWCLGVAAGYVGLAAMPPPLSLAAALALAALALVAWLAARVASTPGGLVAAVVLLAGAAVLLGIARADAGRPARGPGSVAAYAGQAVAITGRARSAGIPSGSAGNPASRLQAFQLEVDSLVARGRTAAPAGVVLVQSRGHAEVFDGQRLTVRGTLVRPRQLGPGGVSGYADRLERQGVVAEISATSVTPLEAPGATSPARLAATVRAGLVGATHDVLPEPEATIVLGEVAGVRGILPAEIDADLVQSGLVHILAISGIKVAIVAVLLQAVAVPLLGRRGALVSIAGIAFYTLVGGATASAVRSAMMASLGLVGAVIRRDTDVVRSLLLAAAAMLAQRPGLVADLSFQYSFLGVLGIHLFAGRVEARVGFLPRPIRLALAVTVAAQLGTLPLTAHYFGVVPLVAPIANALVLPTLPVAMVVGLLAAALRTAANSLPGAWARLAGAATIPPAALALLLARLALLVAHLSRMFPGSAIATPGFGAPAAAGYYTGLGTAALGQARRWPVARTALAASGAGLVALLLLGRPDGRLHAVFPAAVSGPVALLTAPDGATMLVGTGSSAAALTPALDAALPAAAPLPGLPRRLDAVFLTGAGRDEAGGVVALAGRRPALVLTPESMAGAGAAATLDALRAGGAQVTRLRPGDGLAWHGLALHAGAGGMAGQLALQVGWGGARLLIASSSDAAATPPLPAGDYAAVGLGSGAADPGWAGVNAAVVVVQDGGAASNRRMARGLGQAVGQRLWQTSRDGELRLSCDTAGCSRG